jgi:hypothetical protein
MTKKLYFKTLVALVCTLVFVQSPAHAVNVQLPSCSSPAGIALGAAATAGFGWLGMNYTYHPAFFEKRNPEVAKNASWIVTPSKNAYISKPGVLNKALYVATSPLRGALFAAEWIARGVALCSTAVLIALLMGLGDTPPRATNE